MAATDLAKDLKNVSEKDRKQIEQAQEMMGPDPEAMGFMKNLFWGNFRKELVFPYPEVEAEEAARCDRLLADLDHYLENEHPAIQIDRDEEISEPVIKRLFEIGVLGMTITEEYGGLGLGITSYNRVLERIGRSCGSTAVVVSAQSPSGLSFEKSAGPFRSPQLTMRCWSMSCGMIWILLPFVAWLCWIHCW